MSKIALAQVNPTVGALQENTQLVREFSRRAADAGAQLVIFPELVISGYPPDDLLYREDFLAAADELVQELAGDLAEFALTAIVGFPEQAHDAVERPLVEPVVPPAYNSVAIIEGGAVAHVYRKCRLPNYGVFDERRHFLEGVEPLCFDLGASRIGVTVCEDIWLPDGPATAERLDGADLIVNCSASPFARGKGLERERLVADRATAEGIPIALCNLVGGQDELVFDGCSVVCASDGTTLVRGAQFEQDLVLCDLPMGDEPPEERGSGLAGRLAPVPEVYAALLTGLRDYAAKNGFTDLVFGLSGGIDSALVALLAVDAVGPENVHAVVMPSPHSSPETQADARRIAVALGADLVDLPIAAAMDAFERILEPEFQGGEPGLAEENLQARIRGALVMALSNRFGWLPLATGNKSEMAVGYATLYGDMAGGFAPIKDVPKTLVYELVRERNRAGGPPPIPQEVIDRPPSAELRPGQLDVDSLPDYAVLDEIIEGYVERAEGRSELIAAGLPPTDVDDVIRLVDRAEYKRRQAPPGTRISSKAFGRDRRLPVTNRFDPAIPARLSDRESRA